MTVYSITHQIQPWILPPAINLLLGLVGFILWRRWETTGKMLVTLAFVSLWFLCTPIIAYQLVDYLQNQYPVLQPDALPKHNTSDVIVVLGGGERIEMEYDKKHTVSDVTLHRVRYGAFLHNKTHMPIIVSGGNSESTHSEADLMSKVLQDDFNIQVKLKEDKSYNTAEESRLIAPLLKQHGFNNVYLVTNAWHMPRSVYIFKKAGIHVIPAPMGYITHAHDYSYKSFIPAVQALYISSIAIHELIGLVWYHFYY